MDFNAQHLAELDAIVEAKARDGGGDLVLTTQGWLGSACRGWAEWVTRRSQPRLPSDRQNRQQLGRLIEGGALTDEEAYLAVMAWGGQHRLHGQSAWSGFDRLQPIVNALRCGEMDRIAGYRAFYDLTTLERGRLIGLGPAYYTKLLFFLPSAERGPIMDQWTAKSMQLLVDRSGAEPIVSMSNGYVTRHNDADVYERFCVFIEMLAERYSVSAGNAEELVFAGTRQPWRDYVRTHWSRRA